MELPAVTVADVRPPVGVDLGVAARVTLSTGHQEPKRVLDRRELRRRQRRLSRAQRGSGNRYKRRRAMAREWQRVAERERGHLHELTARLVRDVSARWVVEDLRVTNMVRNRHLSRAIVEQQWGAFVQMLTYKAESAGGWVRAVPPHGTSQTCAACGARPPKPIGLGTRTYRCGTCDLVEDRDINAARNVLSRGLEPAGAGGDAASLRSLPAMPGAGRRAAPLGAATA